MKKILSLMLALMLTLGITSAGVNATDSAKLVLISNYSYDLNGKTISTRYGVYTDNKGQYWVALSTFPLADKLLASADTIKANKRMICFNKKFIDVDISGLNLIKKTSVDFIEVGAAAKRIGIKYKVDTKANKIYLISFAAGSKVSQNK